MRDLGESPFMADLNSRWKRPKAFRGKTGISEAAYYRLKRDGSLKTARIGGIVFVDFVAFEELLEENAGKLIEKGLASQVETGGSKS